MKKYYEGTVWWLGASLLLGLASCGGGTTTDGGTPEEDGGTEADSGRTDAGPPPECELGSDTCGPNAMCTAGPGGPTCACNAGYERSGGSCTDIDECATAEDDCHPDARCTNTVGGFECECRAGYRGDGATCTDIDECAEGTAGCDPLVACTNTPGAFVCGDCPVGYIGGGASGCVDIDECATFADECAPDATCRNLPGAYVCSCNAGFMGDGFACADVDECLVGNGGCDADATCGNVPGSRTCVCNDGFSGDGLSCADVDECMVGNGGCDANATCGNVPGSRTCTCNAGYSGDGVTCADVDECLVNNGGCDPTVTCTNTVGSRTCGACPAGSTGDGTFCLFPPSCRAILAARPTSLDGTYRIDPDGTGPAPSLDVYCDMSTDGGVGYTMARFESPTLAGDQAAYRAFCAARGMEVVVPRSRAHAESIAAWNGEPPNLVNVFPDFNGATGLASWTGRCAGEPCDFYLSSSNNSDCAGFEPNGDNDTANALYRVGTGCDYGRWNDAHSAMFYTGWVVCSTNDAAPPTPQTCLHALGQGNVQNRSASGIGGLYTVDPDGSGPIEPYQALCDMSTSGGGWTLVGTTSFSTPYTGAWGTSGIGTPATTALYALPFQNVLPDAAAFLMRYTPNQEFFTGTFAVGSTWELNGPSRRRLLTSGNRLVMLNNAGDTYCAHNAAYAGGWNCDGDDGQVAGQGMFNTASGNEITNCGGFGNSAWKPTAGGTTATVCNPSGFAQLWLRELPRSCREVLALGTTASGTYRIDPDGIGPEGSAMVYCDMATDGGGWTLVSNSTATVDDAASAYSTQLSAATPTGTMLGVWNGLRALVRERSDIRFTCQTTVGGAHAVDLSFYGTEMYTAITTGTDAASCTRTYGAPYQNVPFARRNNLTGVRLPETDRYDASPSDQVIFEDSCGDTGDFTVDFDNHGMDYNQSDGTDWGEDDTTRKCGVNATGAAWQVWVRE